jgi:hypothetical protein
MANGEAVSTSVVERPGHFADVVFDPTSGFRVTFTFITENGTSVDMSDSAVTIESASAGGSVVATPTVDTSAAQDGLISVTYTRDQATDLPIYSQLGIREDGRWNRLVALGRLSQSQHLGASDSLGAEVDDASALQRQVIVLLPSPFGSLGDATWDDLAAEMNWLDFGETIWDDLTLGTTWNSLEDVDWDDVDELNWESV